MAAATTQHCSTQATSEEGEQMTMPQHTFPNLATLITDPPRCSTLLAVARAAGKCQFLPIPSIVMG